MVPTVNHIKTAQGKLFFLKQNLTCSNYGIYAACCLFNALYSIALKTRMTSQRSYKRKADTV